MRIVCTMILAVFLAGCGAEGEPVPPGQVDNPMPDVSG